MGSALAAWIGVAAHDRRVGVRALVLALVFTACAAAVEYGLAERARLDAACVAALGALAVLGAVDALTELVYDGSVIATYVVVLGTRIATQGAHALLVDVVAGLGFAAVFYAAGCVDSLARRPAATGTVTESRIGFGDILVLPVIPLAFGAMASLYVVLLAMVPAVLARAIRRRQVPLLPFVFVGALVYAGSIGFLNDSALGGILR